MVVQSDGSLKAVAKPIMIHADGWPALKGGESADRLACLNEFRKGQGLRRCSGWSDAHAKIKEEYALWVRLRDERLALAAERERG